MEGRGKAFDKHLDQETHYVRQHLQQWKKLLACLRKELETKEQSQLVYSKCWTLLTVKLLTNQITSQYLTGNIPREMGQVQLPH